MTQPLKNKWRTVFFVVLIVGVLTYEILNPGPGKYNKCMENIGNGTLVQNICDITLSYGICMQEVAAGQVCVVIAQAAPGAIIDTGLTPDMFIPTASRPHIAVCRPPDLPYATYTQSNDRTATCVTPEG